MLSLILSSKFKTFSPGVRVIGSNHITIIIFYTMRTNIKNQRDKIVGLAAVAGMRSMSGPSLLSNYLNKHSSKRLNRSSLDFMQSDKAARIFSVLAFAEKIGDKLPGTPNRIKPMALAGRAISGALIGATLSKTNRKSIDLAGAGLGLVSAMAATYASFYLRKKLTKNTFIPDAVWGLAEDFAVARIGKNVLS